MGWTESLPRLSEPLRRCGKVENDQLAQIVNLRWGKLDGPIDDQSQINNLRYSGFFFLSFLSCASSAAPGSRCPLASIISLASSLMRSSAATSSGSVVFVFNEFN